MNTLTVSLPITMPDTVKLDQLASLNADLLQVVRQLLDQHEIYEDMNVEQLTLPAGL